GLARAELVDQAARQRGLAALRLAADLAALALAFALALAAAGVGRRLLAELRREEGALDVGASVRVDLDVRRQVLDRVLVAVLRIDVVDPAVVPVVDQRLPARGRRRGAPNPQREGDEHGEDGGLGESLQRLHRKRLPRQPTRQTGLCASLSAAGEARVWPL